MIIFLMIVGLVLLIFGAELLVRGASQLAETWGISPLIVGLTVVAFGTSSPELAVSLNAVSSGQAGIAVGNVVGSNIFNVLFILGVSAMVSPLIVSRQLIRLDVPLMIAASALVWVFGLDQHFSRLEGVVLFVALFSYIMFLIVQGKRVESVDSSEVNEGGSQSKRNPKSSVKMAQNVVLILVGLGLLVLGSKWLVEGAVWLATLFGVSEVVIGLTIVAAGTSLPEVVTSIVATVRGERDIAVGNVVGSNLFNILGVLGLSSIVSVSGIDLTSTFVGFDLPIMFVVAFACLPIFFSGGIISRWEGALLLAYYIAYTLYLSMAQTSSESLPLFSNAMLYFAVPLTLVTLMVIAFRSREPEGPLSAH